MKLLVFNIESFFKPVNPTEEQLETLGKQIPLVFFNIDLKYFDLQAQQIHPKISIMTGNVDVLSVPINQSS